MTSYFKTSALLLLIFLLSFDSIGQRLEISGMGFYQFGGKVRLRNGDIELPSSGSFGASINYEFAPEYRMEFIWIRQDTELILIDFNDGPSKLTDVAVEYFLAGAMREIDLDKLKPFFSFKVGAANFASKDREIGSETRFAFGISGGARYFFTDHVGIRLQVDWLLPMQWGSAGVFCGTGGCNPTVGGTTSFMQGTVGGGLVFRFIDW